MGLVPKQSKSETKIYKSFTLMRILGLVFTVIISSVLSNICAPSLSWLFIGFCIIVYLILSSKAPDNRTKSFFKGLCAWIRYLFFSKKLYGVNHPFSIANNERKVIKNEKKHKKRKENTEA